MKITLFIPSLIGCGAERVLVNLANYLCRRGHKVCILNYFNGAPSYELDAGIQRRYLFKSQKEPGFFKKIFLYFFPGICERAANRQRLSRLKRFVKRNDTQCYLVMLEQSTIDLLSLRKDIQCPVVVSERNYPGKYRETIRQTLYQLAPLADGFVFQTVQARECYGETVRESTIIPNALNETFATKQPFRGEKRKAIVNVGRLEEQKNQELLIRAFAKTNLPGYVLEIYGDGPLKEHLQSLIDSLNLTQRAFLKGHVDNIEDHIQDADLFVLSSNYEGIPNVVLEAMALGLPCITTDFAGGGAHVLIDHGVNGLIVPVANEAELAESIKTVLTDRALAEKLSRGAVEKVTQFDAETIYSKWESFLVQIAKKAETAGPQMKR